MRDWYVYVLICPLSKEVRYVGISQNPETRVIDHVKTKNSQGTKEKRAWLKEISSYKLTPILWIVENVGNWENAIEMEYYWIIKLHDAGAPLLNANRVPETIRYTKRNLIEPSTIPNGIDLFLSDKSKLSIPYLSQALGYKKYDELINFLIHEKFDELNR